MSAMNQWLLKSGGKIQLVMLVDIEEDKKARKHVKSTFASQKRVKALLKRFGNNKRKALLMLDEDQESNTPEIESDADMYESIEMSICKDDWVGPIKVNVELWEMGLSAPRKRGNRVVSTLLFCISCLRGCN